MILIVPGSVYLFYLIWDNKDGCTKGMFAGKDSDMVVYLVPSVWLSSQACSYGGGSTQDLSNVYFV